MMRKKALGLALVAAGAITAAACTQSVDRATPTPLPPTATQAPANTPEPTRAPAPTATPTRPAATSTSTSAPTPTPKPVPVSTTTRRFGLFLEIDGLSDENVVRGDNITAKGRTSPDAIVSINGVIVPVDAEGNFQVKLALDPGPNIIEVVASDPDGNEVNKVIAVVSLPEGV